MKSSIMIHAIDGEYIREWLVLGPFFPHDLERDFLADVDGEANIKPREGMSFTASDGGAYTWKRYNTKSNVINMLDAVENYENATAYAFCVIQSEVECDADVYFGSIDGAVVWMNGKQVYRFDGRRAFTFDEDVFVVNLKAGENCFLVKVSNLANYWEFTVRMVPLHPNRTVISGLVKDEKGASVPKGA